VTVVIQLASVRKKAGLQIKVALTNNAGEIASETFDVPADSDDPDEIVNCCASDIIEGWILTAGDTITIRKV
jgi:hypothetical protein